MYVVCMIIFRETLVLQQNMSKSRRYFSGSNKNLCIFQKILMGTLYRDFFVHSSSHGRLSELIESENEPRFCQRQFTNTCHQISFHYNRKLKTNKKMYNRKMVSDRRTISALLDPLHLIFYLKKSVEFYQGDAVGKSQLNETVP